MGVILGITSSEVRLKICVITVGIKKYNSIIKKEKKKKPDKIEFFGAKTTLNKIEVLISKTLVDSFIRHEEFISINNVLKEHDEIKENSNKKEICLM